MGGDDAHALGQGSSPATHDQSHGQHGPWQILHGDLDDKEHHFLATVILGVGVGKGEDQG